MSNQHIQIGGNAQGNAIGAGATNTNTNSFNQDSHDINVGDVNALLETLSQDVARLIEKLPAEKKEEAAVNLDLLKKAATAAKPNRAWYSVSSEGLLEASKYVQDFTGNIAGTLGNLGKALGFS